MVAGHHGDFLAADVAGVVEAHAAQEPYGLAHPLEVASRHIERFGLAGAGAYEDGIETGGEEIVDGEVAAYGDTGVENYAEVGDLGYFVAHHVLGKTVLGNAVHEHAAGFGTHLVDFDGHAFAGKLAGYGEACGSAADHGNASAGFLHYVFVGEVHCRIEIGNKFFKTTDAHRTVLAAKNATALALPLVGAHAAAHGGEVAFGVDYGQRVAEIAHGHLVNPVGYVVFDRACFTALRHLAVETSFCLGDGACRREIGVLLHDCCFLILMIIRKAPYIRRVVASNAGTSLCDV